MKKDKLSIDRIVDFVKANKLFLFLEIILLVFIYIASNCVTDLTKRSIILGLLYISIILNSFSTIFASFLSNSTPEDSIIDRVLMLSISLLLTSPVFIYLITLVISEYSNNLLVIIGDQIAWISFSGSVIGGSITMFALVFTIQHQNFVRKEENEKRQKEIDEERALIYMPIINVELVNDKEILHFNETDKFAVKCCTQNPLRSFEVTCIEICTFDDKLLYSIPKDSLATFDTSIIEMTNPHYINAFRNESINIMKIISASYYKKLKVNIHSTYFDITQKNKHSHMSKFQLTNISPESATNIYASFNMYESNNEYLGIILSTFNSK